MKKIYTLLVVVLAAFTAYNQTPILTMISDGDCAGGTPKVVEIYAQGAVDFSLYSLEIQTNGNTNWVSTENLTALGTVTDDFVYLYGSAAAAIFATEYPSALNTYGAGGCVNFNGDDRIRIIEDATGNVIDQYGEEGIDGTGIFWEYKDGYSKRVDATGPDGAFVQVNWEYNNGVLNNEGTCQGGSSFESILGTASFVAPGGGTDPTVSASPAEINGFIQFVGAPSDEQTTEVTGSNLTSDVTATVSGDYEISLSTASGFGNSVVLTQTAGELAATMLYVRLNGTAPTSPSISEIILDYGTDIFLVPLTGEILNPDAILFSSIDTLLDFSHFVGTPSAEQSFEVSGNYLTDDLTIDVTGEYEISAVSNGTFSNSLTLPSYSNATVVDASANWLGYMNVSELPENGGGFQFGGPWGLSDLQTILVSGANALRLYPNFNTYSANLADSYWVNQTTGAGNKNMEAITFLEPGVSANGNDLSFMGTVASYTLDAQYSAKYFIKALDPNNGYADVFNGSKIFDIPTSGVFTVSATAAELPVGLIVQYGFMVIGPNANPADAATLGSVVIEGDMVAGEVSNTPIFVRLNGVGQNYNQTGAVTVSSVSETIPGAHTVNAGSFYYAPQVLTVNIGDTVYWVNEGGFHNVNFVENTVSGENFNNPESFVSPPTSDAAMYSYVFTVEGTYQYDCSVGAHAANGMVGTIIVLGSDSPESKTVALLGETLDYSPATIADVTTNDADGLVDSLDVYVSLEGVVHCVDFDSDEGLSFSIIDIDNNGINVYNFADVSAYVVNEGDMIRILGQIDQFNGLTQVLADSIIVISADMPTVTPTVVTALNEDTESQWITLESVNFVDPIATFPTGNNNLDVTDGTNVYTIRIDGDTDIPGGAVPQGLFDVTGIGGQYDSSSPFDSGYQLFPCGLGSFVLNDVSGITEAFATLSVSPNPFQDYVSINTSGVDNVSVSILDVQGRLISSLAVSNGMEINTSAWEKGMYLFTFTDGNQNIRTERMIK